MESVPSPPPFHHLCVHLLPQHLDVYDANSQFSRKVPGDLMYILCIVPCNRVPTHEELTRMALAAAPVPLKVVTVEKGDIAFYGINHVQLNKLH